MTGAAGQIGNRLVDRLIKDGHDVIPLSHSNCDVKDYDALDFVFSSIKKVDTVVHLASHLPNTPDPDFYGVNIDGTKNVINVSEKYKVDKLIFASSMRVYATPPTELPVRESHLKNPLDPYGWTKYACEEMIRWSSLKYVIIRYGGVYGNGNFGVIHKFLTSDKIYLQGDGTQSTDFIHVDDAIQGTILLLDKEGIYNLSSGQETPISILAKYCSLLTGAEVVNDEKNTDRPFRFVSDVTKIKELGLVPRDLLTGITEYWRELNDRR